MPQARINFTPPTLRSDNVTPLALAEIASYRVERLPNAGGSWETYGSPQPASGPVVVAVNSGDAHQYRLSTIDTGGRVSSVSAPVEIRFDAIPPPLANPLPPTSLSVTYLP